MSDPRRRARQKPQPVFGSSAEGGPFCVTGETVQHPLYGRCRVWFKGGSIYRVSSERPVIPDYEFSVYDRRLDATRFLLVLGLIGFGE